MPEPSSPPTPGCVAAVTVTYGRRWKYLRRVIERLREDPWIGPIVVVDNAALDPVSQAVAEAGWAERVSVVEIGENAGSARGYKVGIREVLARPEVDFVFLLDDDNLPRPDALDRLMRVHRAKGSHPCHALLALRPDRSDFVRAARGERRIRVRENSFLGFHALEVPEKIRRKLLQHDWAGQPRDAPDRVCRVQYAPYGGLLLHRDLISRIGLPDEAFYLYSDDHEYSSRIEEHGGELWLCSGSIVDDIERSWHIGASKVHPLFDLDASEMRVYYSTRNRVYFEHTRFVVRPAIYAFNKWLYLLSTFGLSVARAGEVRRRARRLRFVIGSAARGARGELGRVMTWSEG